MQGVRRLAGAVELDLQVVPRASQESLGPVHGERLKLHVSAPPVDGAANEAVRVLLARLLGVPRAQVEITRGETGRKKTVRVHGEVEGAGGLWARIAGLVDLVPSDPTTAATPGGDAPAAAVSQSRQKQQHKRGSKR